MCLAKDSFCFHYGSVTLKNDNTEKNFMEGRKKFKALFGVDPWMTGFCYSYVLFQRITFDKKGSVKILGVNCGFGSDPLKIKEILREQVHNENVYLKNVTTRKEVLEDLRSISDEVEVIEDYSELKETETYDYVICEDFEPVYMSMVEFLKKMSVLKKPDGILMAAVGVSVGEEIERTRREMEKYFPEAIVFFEKYINRYWIVI